MVHGTLITNAFLRTEKFVEHYDWLREAAKQHNIALSLLENADLLTVAGEGENAEEGKGMGKNLSPMERVARENDFILYWDKDIAVGRLLEDFCEKYQTPVFNSIEAIEICDDKMETYRKLQQWNHRHKECAIPLIPSVMAPMTYENIGYTKVDFVDEIIDRLGLPVVIKECHGSFGMQVYLAKDRKEAKDYTMRLAGKPFLYQKYISQSCGRDIRLQVVGDKVVAAMERKGKQGDFRANITNGGTMKPYTPSVQECEMARNVVRALHLDFAGVDILFAKGLNKEERMVCEVNSNAHFKNIYECTGVNVATHIMEHICRKIGAKSGEEND